MKHFQTLFHFEGTAPSLSEDKMPIFTLDIDGNMEKGIFLYRLHIFGGDVIRFRIHVACMQDVVLANAENGVIQVEYQNYFEKESHPIKLVIVGEDAEERKRHTEQVYEYLSLWLDQREDFVYQIQDAKDAIKEAKSQEKLFYGSEIQDPNHELLKGRYGADDLPFVFYVSIFYMLPGDLEQLRWVGALPSKKEVRLATTLSTYANKLRFVLCFKKRAEYDRFFKQIEDNHIDLIYHQPIERSNTQAFAIFFFEEGFPIPTFVYSIPQKQEKEDFHVSRLREIAEYCTYESYLEKEGIEKKDPRYIPAFLNHRFGR